MIFWLWEVQKGTSSLHREMERPSKKFAWGEEKNSITCGKEKGILFSILQVFKRRRKKRVATLR
jgi:hypothetical protein